MPYQLNSNVHATTAPPIAEAQAWVSGRRKAQAQTFLELAQAVPSAPPAPRMIAHLKDRLGAPETARYTAIAGTDELRSAYASHLEQTYGATIGPGNVVISAGCNQAFCLALSALAKAGDEVILPLPYYFNHQMWLDINGIRARHLPFRHDRHGVPDPADAAVALTPHTRAIVLVSPNNPTGAVYPADVLKAFYDLARKAGIALVLDETYKDFLPHQDAAHDLFREPDWGGTLVHLYSFSKAYRLAGYRVGALAGSLELVAAVAKVMDTLAICAPRIAQDAALFGLQNLTDWRETNRREMAARVAEVRELFGSHDCAYKLVSAGAYFALVRHPFAGRTATEVAQHLVEEHDMLCLPGTMFGPGMDDYLRLAFANLSTDQIPEAVDRLRACA